MTENITENINVQVNDGSQFGLNDDNETVYMVIREINFKDSENIRTKY